MYRVVGTHTRVYLSKRVNGRQTTVYVGTGPHADALVAELESRKQSRRIAAQACAEWQARTRAADGPLDVWCAAVDQFVTAALLDRGYHRRDRGKWRRRRVRHPVPVD